MNCQYSAQSHQTQGDQNLCHEHWGETLTHVVEPVAVVLDLVTEQCTVLRCGEEVYCARWVPRRSDQLIFASYMSKPVKYGFISTMKARR